MGSPAASMKVLGNAATHDELVLLSARLCKMVSLVDSRSLPTGGRALGLDQRP